MLNLDAIVSESGKEEAKVRTCLPTWGSFPNQLVGNEVSLGPWDDSGAAG